MKPPLETIQNVLTRWINANTTIIAADVPRVASDIYEALKKGKEKVGRNGQAKQQARPRVAVEQQVAARPARSGTSHPQRRRPVSLPLSPSPEQTTEAVSRAIVQCESIMEACEEIPDNGADFATSVYERVQSIAATIEDRNHVTERQREALDNMQAGVERWLE